VEVHIDIVPAGWYTVYGVQDSVFSRYLPTVFMERGARKRKKVKMELMGK